MKRKILSVLLVLVVMLTLGLVTAVPVAAADLSVPGTYVTIQAAINAANSGDIIVVAAGTYVEDLIIPEGKDNLELAGAEGATIKGVVNVPIASWPLAVPNIEVLANGVSIHGFTIEGPDYAADCYASGLVLDGLDIEIYDNSFVDTPANNTDELSHSITTYSLTAIEDADPSGLNIHDNTFVGSGAIGSEFIYVCPHTGTGTITIDNNQFNGSVFIGATFESGEVSFTNNTITNETEGSGLYGVRFMDSEYGTNGDYNNIVISGNEISDFVRAVRVGNGSNPNTAVFVATISSNTLTNNELGVWGRNGSQLVVVGNAIFDNTVGILNGNGDDTPPSIDATGNWWGTIDGSAIATMISGDVDYSPWWGESYLTGTAPNIELVDHPWTWYTNDSIQDTIDAATAGDTIIVSAGIYTEDLTVNIADLTIRSETGKANTTIQLVDGVGIDIQDGASGFTLGGAVGEGFIVKSSSVGSTTFNIQLANAPSGVEISYNTIDTRGNASQGVSVGAAGATDLTITYNDFIAEVGDGSIWGVRMVNVVVLCNTFTGPGSTTNGYAVQFAGVTGTSTISFNNITGYGLGVTIMNGEGTSTLTIVGNTISGCANGIWFVEYGGEGDMTTVAVALNTLKNNTTGLKISASTYILASNFIIEYNNFIENGFGLQNASAELVTAEKNWWGDVAGPNTSGNTMHNPYENFTGGDDVSDNVDYLPWLIQIDLVKGWNIWSDPIVLDEACLAQLDAQLTEEVVDVAYYFDSTTQDWWNIPEDASPMDAWYIKMKTPVTVNIWASSEATFPWQKEMKVGWNFVGLAELCPLPAPMALASALYGTGEAGLWGYSQVMSPSLNGQPWTYMRDQGQELNPWEMMEFWPMFPTKGYWVLMTNDGILGGFSSTPIVEVEFPPEPPEEP